MRRDLPVGTIVVVTNPALFHGMNMGRTREGDRLQIVSWVEGRRRTIRVDVDGTYHYPFHHGGDVHSQPAWFLDPAHPHHGGLPSTEGRTAFLIPLAGVEVEAQVIWAYEGEGA